MDTLKLTYYFSVIVQIIALVFQNHGLNYTVSPENEPLKYALKLEYYVSIIELIVYIWIGMILSKVKDITPRRYIDWVITTTILLVSTSILFIYEKQKQDGFIERKTAEEMIIENKDTLIKISIANLLMLLFGFLGETKQINKYTGLFLGMAFFIYGFYTIYDSFAKQSVFGVQFFTIFTIVWILYAVAYLMSPIVKNSMYNILDLISKNAFGIYLMYRVSQVSI
jgi:bacteriorhodopsin